MIEMTEMRNGRLRRQKRSNVMMMMTSYSEVRNAFHICTYHQLTTKHAHSIFNRRNMRILRLFVRSLQINEISRKVLMSIDAAMIAAQDNGNCLKKTLCENSKFDKMTQNKMWLPVWRYLSNAFESISLIGSGFIEIVHFLRFQSRYELAIVAINKRSNGFAAHV